MSKREGTNGLSSLLGTGVDCDGTARVEGTLRLDGSFRGNLEVGETLIIGQSGWFRGTACGRSVIIAGRFEGEVLGTEQVELQKGGRMEGDVLTRSFVIEPGVFFEGSCKMEFTEADEARLRVRRADRPETDLEGPAGTKPDRPVADDDETLFRALPR
ncbi:MAG: polymer-forming cytoskeletal protein [Gemmatimonadetes bacterium]|nr:polymer-forming cytoskeletal protein [Gemmatimonadota bacterium]